MKEGKLPAKPLVLGGHRKREECMKFEEVLTSLNKKGIMLHGLSQIEDGKTWSASVRKKGTTKTGYGYGKSFDKAIKEALATMKDSFSPTEFSKSGSVKNPVKVKKKRTRLRGR